MEADQAVAELRFVLVGDIEGLHQGENADAEDDGGDKRAEVAQAGKEAEDEVSGGNGPGDEGHGLIEVVDGAALEAEAAEEHGAGVEEDTGEQEEVIDMIVTAEALAPEEDGINGAAAVDDNGDQEATSSIMPEHGVSITVRVSG